jgi:LPS export ABC transporter protein LptC
VQRGIPVKVIARPLKNPRFEKLISTLRQRLGVGVVHESGDLRPAFRALRRNEVLGILIDQGRRWPGAWVPFFGRPAHMTTAAAEFARRARAPLVPMGIQRKGMRHRITVLPPIEIDWERPGAVVAATAALARSLESLIWRCPAQWSWSYDLWSVPASGSEAGSGNGKVNSGPGAGDPAVNDPPDEREAPDRPAAKRPFARLGRIRVAHTWLLILLAAAVTFTGACRPGDDRADLPPERPPSVGEPIPSQELSQFVLRETDESGRVAWIFQAEQAQIFEARDEVEAKKIHIDFFDPEGQVASVLVADRAVIERRTNDMQASGHVVVRNSDGDQLFTEELHYSGDREKIYTDEFVRVLRGRDELTGYGLETDPDLRGGELEIQRDFRATMRDESVPPIGPDLGAGSDANRSARDETANQPAVNEDESDAGTP